MSATIEVAFDAAWAGGMASQQDGSQKDAGWLSVARSPDESIIVLLDWFSGDFSNMACSLDNTRTHLPLSNHLRQEYGLQPRQYADSPTSTRRQEGSTVDWTEEPAQDEKEVFDQLCGMLRDIYFQRRHTLLESYTPVKDHLRQEYGLQPRQSLRRCGHGCDSWKKILSRRPKRSMRKHFPSC